MVECWGVLHLCNYIVLERIMEEFFRIMGSCLWAECFIVSYFVLFIWIRMFCIIFLCPIVCILFFSIHLFFNQEMFQTCTLLPLFFLFGHAVYYSDAIYQWGDTTVWIPASTSSGDRPNCSLWMVLLAAGKFEHLPLHNWSQFCLLFFSTMYLNCLLHYHCLNALSFIVLFPLCYFCRTLIL